MAKHAIACLAALSVSVFLNTAAMATHHTKVEPESAAPAQAGPPPGLALGWPTNGRPATEKDLVGKKICWDNGRVSIFGANGQYTNDRGHHMSWLVTEPGTVKVGERYTQYLILPDGGIYNHWYSGHKSITGHKEHWGKVCT